MTGPAAPIDCDLCVIGAGSGGLSVAAGAAQLGLRTVLIEGGRMGGECLNTGCVPSKALLAAADHAASARRASSFGVDLGVLRIDWHRVRAHVDAVIAAIAPNDSVERFEGLGVTVLRDWARFTASDTVEAGGRRIHARRFVLAVGSAPAVPPIPGLDAVPYLTNETIFACPTPIERLVIIGGGPVGAELAQAHARLGSTVTVMQKHQLLAREDPALVGFVRNALRADGVTLHEGAGIAAVSRRDADLIVRLDDGTEIAGTHLLVATGRRPNLDRLDLAAAGIAPSPRGIPVDRRLRSANRRIYAVGDCADVAGIGPMAFTHVAGEQAGIVIRNALFRLPARFDPARVPRVTYTDPELAAVGLSMAEAKARHPDCRILEADFAENDRAQTEKATAGRIRIAASSQGRILGVAIAGRHAGELLAPWCLALAQGLKLSAMAQVLLPYPTLAELSKRAAGQFYAPKLFGPTWTGRAARGLVGLLQRLP
jgi:pyruvate/2-oxoglutarate dehydrogenase complex dihydrolipoamide dehydrogenase (E3) component